MPLPLRWIMKRGCYNMGAILREIGHIPFVWDVGLHCTNFKELAGTVFPSFSVLNCVLNTASSVTMTIKSETKQTNVYDGQKPGTSGLRKPVTTFQQENYVENFVQSIFLSIENVPGSTLVVGGDGRYFMSHAIQVIIRMAAANKVRRLLIGRNGILSTPALSHLIRKHKALGGIVLTASHNPGGPNADFGIKYNISNGGPAPESITSKIAAHTLKLTSYKSCEIEPVDLSKCGTSTLDIDGETFEVEIVDSVKDYVAYMEEIFDFNLLKKFVTQMPDRFVADAMHGVTGPYIKEILCEKLCVTQSAVINCIPMEDFGGLHPDPNMTYAKDFVDKMANGDYEIGAAFDGDGDRNMILGNKAFFVNPSDSIAVIAANASCIPYFAKNGLKGVARSMPTSMALDKVAAKAGMQCYEVPTGWKFFGNLMDAGQLSLCGEESFGTGSDHIREKDGIWAFLAWLSIVAHKKQSVETILQEHWETYGRNFFMRYDYENVNSEPAKQMMDSLKQMVANGSLIGKEFDGKLKINMADDFQYTDPIDGCVTKNQGIRISFDCGSRIVFRLSGTGSTGATIRVYMEAYTEDPLKIKLPASEALKDVRNVALTISKLEELTGRTSPTVIT